jgi:hypothetical protein
MFNPQEIFMRFIAIIAVAAGLSACATQEMQPTTTAAAKKAPQCWSGDHSKFFNLGEKTSIAGVSVECKPTSDGKAAQWVGAKH